jgi:hypothetical protein
MMSDIRPRGTTRRAVLGALGVLPAFAARSLAAAAEALSPSQMFRQAPPPVTAAGQVLNVMEFEALARDALPPAHFGYIATGADDDRTVSRNHECVRALRDPVAAVRGRVPHRHIAASPGRSVVHAPLLVGSLRPACIPRGR